LCSLLSSTGVAGRPESYFRNEDLVWWARRFGVSLTSDNRFDYREYAAGVLREGSTPNGVFATRVMWGSLEHVIDGLALRPGARSDLDVLAEAFGPLRVLYLRREDVIGQAVSWARALQTGYYQHGDKATAEPTFDHDQIDELVHTIEEHNAAWSAWFTEQGADPYSVTYEDLVADPRSTTEAILRHLNLGLPPEWRPSPPHKRQADQVNSDWVQRYRARSSSG